MYLVRALSGRSRSLLSKRLFVWAPLVLIGVYALGCVVAHADERFIYGGVSAAKLLGGVGLALAAWRYNRGEYLFWAWALLSVQMILLGAAELFFTARFNLFHLTPVKEDVCWAVLMVLANGAASVGTIMLARVWRMVGLALPDPSGGKRLLTLGGIVVSIVVVAYAITPEWKAMLAGHPIGAGSVAGVLTDLVCFSVIMPLGLRALALRGGTLAWPWGLLASSLFAWMLYDVLVELNLPLPVALSESLVNGVRVSACLLAMGAGLAQRWAVRAKRH
jgi:hypothetical protein